MCKFDVFNDSEDGDAHLLLVDDKSNAGIDVRNSPLATDTPTVNIFFEKDLTRYNDFYFEEKCLATAQTTRFANRAWTHVVITKIGDWLTDDCGEQMISADLGKVDFPAVARIGPGYYATNYMGGNGVMMFRNISVTDVPGGVLAARKIYGMAVGWLVSGS